jgi:hypothetical protein
MGFSWHGLSTHLIHSHAKSILGPDWYFTANPFSTSPSRCSTFSRRSVAVRFPAPRIYTKCPFPGVCKLASAPNRRASESVTSQVQCLMLQLELEAPVPGPSSSMRYPEHRPEIFSVPIYQSRCVSVWRRITTNSGLPSSHHDTTSEALIYRYPTAFDCLFLLSPWRQQLFELHV